jgi:PHD/YefM family antitoxin component YafN of YafNO toxin-antitoxin module
MQEVTATEFINNPNCVIDQLAQSNKPARLIGGGSQAVLIPEKMWNEIQRIMYRKEGN